MTDSKPHKHRPLEFAALDDSIAPECPVCREYSNEDYWRLVEQLEAAQERLTAYETPGWINSVQKVMEYRQHLRETWDDYALAIDEHASEEVRKEARHSMLRRFSAFEEQGWLSNPASSRRIEVEITGDGSGVALPPIVEGYSAPRESSPASVPGYAHVGDDGIARWVDERGITREAPASSAWHDVAPVSNQDKERD